MKSAGFWLVTAWYWPLLPGRRLVGYGALDGCDSLMVFELVQPLPDPGLELLQRTPMNSLHVIDACYGLELLHGTPTNPLHVIDA